MRFQAVIFDMDGTLLDTESRAIQAGIATLTALGLPQLEDVLHDLVGRAGPEVNDILRAGFGQDLDIDHFKTTWDINMREACASGIPQKPGAADLLAHLSAQTMPIALGTNADSASALVNTGRAGLGAHFTADNIFGRDRSTAPKPAPDIFWTAAQYLGAAPEHCIVFEDSEVGTAAALAAGMTVVQVPDQRPAATQNAHFRAATLLDGARAAGLI